MRESFVNFVTAARHFGVSISTDNITPLNEQPRVEQNESVVNKAWVVTVRIAVSINKAYQSQCVENNWGASCQRCMHLHYLTTCQTTVKRRRKSSVNLFCIRF